MTTYFVSTFVHHYFSIFVYQYLIFVRHILIFIFDFCSPFLLYYFVIFFGSSLVYGYI
ncbi:hypothetical protein BDR07DRAFT_1401406 [Suillus spraguei]|nr:hypothetical protein BDR07DRAFT_1401406 [Suillus spraguei]